MRKKRKWWIIVPLSLLTVLLVAILAVFVMITRVLPLSNLPAMASNFKMKSSVNTREKLQYSKRDYSSLPELMKMSDGTAVNKENWQLRREELIKLFKAEVYGNLPTDGFESQFNVVESGEALNGKAMRYQVEIATITAKGTHKANMLLYVPKTTNPVPVVVGLNFRGNHSVYPDNKILLSENLDDANRKKERGSDQEAWGLEKLIEHNIALATIYREDFSKDTAKAYQNGIISLFDIQDFKTIGAWSFGLQRAIDYLVNQPMIDANKVIVFGHSRLGKAALWTGALDERVSLTISNDSGSGGAALSRNHMGETLKSMNSTFPHWFSDSYKVYNDKVDKLPVDQHFLLASIAPRKLYVGSSSDDLWADPVGEYNSLELSKPAYKMLGLDVFDTIKRPDVGSSAKSEAMGYHMRSGWHGVKNEDWDNYIQYIEEYIKK